jgi:hypothetical protein
MSGSNKIKSDEYLVKADIGKIACVDERNVLDDTDNLIAVKIPGGVYGIVDALKSVLHISEDKAWNIVARANLPIVIHTGPEHGHYPNEVGKVGPKGCGYAKLVQNSPEKVSAPEAVGAGERLERVKKLGGKIYIVTGEHKIDRVVIVRKEGMTINQKRALENGVGILDCDVWATGVYADKINEVDPGINLNKEEFVEQITKEFRAVAAVLAPKIAIEEIR